MNLRKYFVLMVAVSFVAAAGCGSKSDVIWDWAAAETTPSRL